VSGRRTQLELLDPSPPARYDQAQVGERGTAAGQAGQHASSCRNRAVKQAAGTARSSAPAHISRRASSRKPGVSRPVTGTGDGDQQVRGPRAESRVGRRGGIGSCRMRQAGDVGAHKEGAEGQRPDPSRLERHPAGAEHCRRRGSVQAEGSPCPRHEVMKDVRLMIKSRRRCGGGLVRGPGDEGRRTLRLQEDEPAFGLGEDPEGASRSSPGTPARAWVSRVPSTNLQRRAGAFD